MLQTKEELIVVGNLSFILDSCTLRVLPDLKAGDRNNWCLPCWLTMVLPIFGRSSGISFYDGLIVTVSGADRIPLV